LFSQQVTLGITTTTDSVRYSPRHVFAAWVEDDSCRFVKSLEVSAVRRIRYLYTWNIVSKANTVDAVTGATLTEPKSHTLIWNCKDLNGNTVPNGNYTIRIEFTGQHAQGPIYSVAFTKSPYPQTITHSDSKFFKGIVLDFVPR
jgi:hypothetical protein